MLKISSWPIAPRACAITTPSHVIGRHKMPVSKSIPCAPATPVAPPL